MGNLSANIIGLTDKNCSCFTDDQPADFATQNVSESGFYITDPKYGYGDIEHIASATNCSEDDLYDMLITARAKAVHSFETDLAIAIREKFASRANTKVNLGRQKFTGARNTSQAVLGQVIRPQNYRYASLYITGIYLALNQSGESVTVKVRSNDAQYMDSASGVFTETSYSVTSVANKFVKVTSGPTEAAPLEIPFFNQLRPNDLEYFITYELPAGAQPVDNTYYCCNDKPSWMRKHLSVCGIEANTDTLEALTDNSVSGSNTANGLLITGYIQCTETKFLADMDEIGGQNTLQSIGRIVQMQSAINLIERVLETVKVNRLTLDNTRRKKMETRAMRFQEMYKKNLAWVVANMPKEATQCLDCKAKEGFSMHSLQA